jgi:AraC-like DNA-binding protein
MPAEEMLGDSRGQLVDASTVRIASVSAIPKVLRELGVDPQPLLEQAGMDLAFFDDPDRIISFAARSGLVQVCVERTGCNHFGLLVGAHNGLQTLGLLGLLMKYSPDVQSALRSLLTHLHLHGRGGMNTLAVNESRALLAFEIYLPGSVATDQIGDGAIMFMFNILRDLCGPDWLPEEAWFAHRRPADIGPYQHLLRVPLRFDAEQYAIVFKTDDLARPLLRHDALLYRYLQHQVDRLESEQADDLPRQVRIALRHAIDDGRFGAEQIARRFAMHARTLNRRLQISGTSFRALVEETRFEMARQLLQDTVMDVRQIALVLGYTHSGTFTRAFRRWSGVTPGQWRAERSPDADAPPIDARHRA